MDVRCERCSTEYEFDDALVSGRGTTVKCTTCGHKFKIRRSDGDFTEDFWNVATAGGKTLVFTSLRELQRAIHTRAVGRNDLLSRGGLEEKPIGQIPELAPFFEQRDARSSRPPPPPGAAPASLGPPPQRTGTMPDFPPPAAAVPSVSPAVSHDLPAALASPPVPPDVPVAEPLTAVAPEPPPPDVPSLAPEMPSLSPASRPGAMLPPDAPEPLAKPSQLASRMPPAMLPEEPRVDDVAHVAHVAHVALGEHLRPSVASAPPSSLRRRPVGGTIIGVTLLVGVAIVGVLWAKDHLGPSLTRPVATVAPVDPRVGTLLGAGEKALADGNLDLAKESFDKASALGEKDPRVLLDVARLAALRADVPWLETRLLPPDATDAARVASGGLSELGAAARRAADA
ncbi:MAG: repeat protein, partial [Labilithrix sp.]|nr:repeat protein [Labilithrix sp.]